MRETRQRGEVLGVLQGGQAFAAQELHERLRARGSTVGLATVYRTLNRLASEGAVDILREDPMQARYRLCSQRHHHHLVCDNCGSVVEIPECDVDIWAKKVARAHGFKVRAHHAEIMGRCSRCARAQRRSRTRSVS